MFELDRYFVPKELVLHVVALLVLLFVVRRSRRIETDTADVGLALFLVWSAASSIFATNHWLAQRSLAVSLSSAVIFWSARSLSSAGLRRPLLGAVALGGIVAAITSLLQAYGVESEFFTLARSPGGTLGNRNFVAHLAAITIPATAWFAVTARKQWGALVGSLGVGALTAVLVLSRSRAAWLAVAACVLVIAVPLIFSRRHWSDLMAGRFARLLLASVMGLLLSVVLPNALNWKSDSPYLDSARNVVDYSKGSGQGRIAQYRNSLEMAKSDPVFGAGPGNWPVRYTRFAPRGDKSLLENGMTANPWPSSDWVAFVSERGIVATLALLAAFAALFFGSLRKWRELGDGDAVLAKVALAGTITATMVVSAFDAVLLLPAPALIAWLAIGACAGKRRSPRVLNLSSRTMIGVGAVVLLLSGISVARSTTMTVAMSAVGRGGSTAGWIRGALWDPGSYRINLRVAELQVNRGRCARARPFATRASKLFPGAAAPKRILRRCR